MKCFLLLLAGCFLLAAEVFAQVSVHALDQDVKVLNSAGVRVRSSSTTSKSAINEADVVVGGIIGDVDIEGVAVINGRVSIDGKSIPTHVRRYKSPKTGKVYLIERKDGSVSVSEVGEGK